MTSKIFYLTNDPERALGLETILPNFHIVCIDNNGIVDELIDKGHNVFCLERELGERNVIFRNSNKLLSHPKTREYLQLNADPATDFLVTFKISPSFEKTAQDLGYKVLNTSAELNRKFENKLSQFRFLNRLDVPIPKSFVGVLEEVDYENAVTELGSPFVIQFDRGHTGTGTLFVETKIEYDTLRERFSKREIKYSEFIKGEAWTLNAVTTKHGVFYGGLSYQITGVPELTNKDGATVGNDWTKAKDLPKKVIDELRRITEVVGEALYENGYKGLFGLDLIVNENEVHLIEINARQPASTSIHMKLALKNNQIPLQLLHISEFVENSMTEIVNESLGQKYTEEELTKKLNTQNDSLQEGYNAAQFVIRNQSDDRIALDQDLRNGIYSDTHVLLRPGYSICDIVDTSEYLLIMTPSERYISQGSEIARVQVAGSVLDKQGKLKEHFKGLVNKINSLDNYQV